MKNNIQMHAKHSTQLSIRNPRSRRHDTGWRPLVRGRRRVLERRGQQTWREELRAWSHDNSGWASLEARVRRAFVEQAPAWLPAWLVNRIVGKGPSQISASRPMINNALSCDWKDLGYAPEVICWNHFRPWDGWAPKPFGIPPTYCLQALHGKAWPGVTQWHAGLDGLRV